MHKPLFLPNSSGLSTNIFSNFFEKFDIQDLTNLLTMSQSWQDKFTKRTIPDYIPDQTLNGAFLINFYGTGLTLTGILLLLMALFIIEIFTNICKRGDQRKNRDKTLVHHLRVIAFNTFLVQLASKASDIIMYFWIEMKSPQPDGIPKTDWDKISHIFAIVMVSMLVVFMLYSYFILLRKSQKKVSKKKFPKFAQKWKSYQIVFSGIKNDEALFVKFFYLIYLTLGVVSSVFDIFQQIIPRINGTIQIAISLLTLWILIVERPLRSRLNMVQLVLIELSDISLRIAGFFVSFDKFTEIAAWRNMGVSALLVLFLFVKLVREIRMIRKYKKQRPKVAKTIWLQVLVPIIQQFLGFGFEHFKLSHFYVKSSTGYEKSINEDQIKSLYDQTDSD